jgi:hypothetical protein
MWVIIEFNRANELQSNHALIQTHIGLINFVNSILVSTKYSNAKLVMIPLDNKHPHKKMYPLVTSDTCDFYAQWMDFPID